MRGDGRPGHRDPREEEEAPTSAEPPKSRSQLRREEDERQEVAAQLVDLPSGKVDRLALDGDLREAIREAAAVRQYIPRRRARLHVATLLRPMPLDELRKLARRISALRRGG